MLNWVYGLTVKLKATLRAGDTEMQLSGADALQLNRVGAGNHIHLTLAVPGYLEVIRYTHGANWRAGDSFRIPIQRDVLTTGTKSFAAGTCAAANWDSATAREFILQTVAP